MAICHLNQLPCTIDKGEESYQLLIQTVWLTDGDIEISLLYPSTSNDGYVGFIQRTNLKSTADSLEIPFDAIHSETTKALTTNGGISNFLYDLNLSACEFILRKQTGNLNVISERVRVPLKAVPSLKDELLKRAIDLNISNSNRFTNVSLEFDNFKREHAKLKVAYNDIVAENISLENELVSKFIVILNSKKDKITKLQKDLKHVSDRLRKLEGTTAKRSKQPRPFSDDEMITTNDTEVASSQETDDDVIESKESHHGSAERVLNDSEELYPAIVLPRRTKTATIVKKNEIGSTAQADDYADLHVAGPSKVVPASLSRVTDSQSVFDQNTDQLLNDM